MEVEDVVEIRQKFNISSINSFVLSTDIEKANKIIKQEQALKLSQQDAMLLVDALDKPVKPNKKLREAFNTYDKKSTQ